MYVKVFIIHFILDKTVKQTQPTEETSFPNAEIFQAQRCSMTSGL